MDTTVQRSGVFPTPMQLDLLRAALWDGDEALAAWHAWHRQVEATGQVGSGSYRLLALLSANLQRLGYAGPWATRLKGVYKRTWCDNNVLFQTIRPALAKLAESGIPLTFLKGIPLSLAYYESHAARPMGDIDVLVPHPQAEAALAVLDQGGFKRDGSVASATTRFRHSIPYVLNGRDLDVHWYLLPDCRDPRLTAAVIEHAEPFTFEGVAGRIPSPTDMLFHVLLHGLRWNPDPPLRWVADAWKILHRREGDIDWDRFVRQADAFAFGYRSRLALSWLAREMRAPVPDTVLGRLPSHPQSWIERAEESYLLRDHAALYGHPLGKLWITFVEYQAEGSRARRVPHMLGFSHFARERWRARGRLELVLDTAKGLARRLGVTAAHR